MKNGDISNIGSPSFYIWEDTLFKKKTKGRFMLRKEVLEINQKALRLMEYMYLNTEFNINIILRKSTKDSIDKGSLKVNKDLNLLPFNRIIEVIKENELASLILSDEGYLVCDNVGLLSFNASFIISIDETYNLLRRRRGRK